MRVLTTLLLLAALLAPRPAAGSGGDPLLEKQWGLEKIQAVEAWSHLQGKGALVAVIDSGIDLRHPDLRTRVAKGGQSFVNNNHSPQDDNGHGTHVSGIIAAAAGNGHGGSGVAPKAMILPVKVCDVNGSCEEEDVAKGVLYAARQGADVINLSLGFGYVTSRSDLGSGPLDMATKKAWEMGAIIVAAAGNEGLPLCKEPADTPAAPVVCVGATEKDDSLAFYSNTDAAMGTTYLVAPGGSWLNAVSPGSDCDGGILSTYLRSAAHAPCSTGSGYDVASGTSMAAPFVSGVAALLASEGLNNGEIVETIISTTDDLGLPGRDPSYGYGRVNALKAVTAR